VETQICKEVLAFSARDGFFRRCHPPVQSTNEIVSMVKSNDGYRCGETGITVHENEEDAIGRATGIMAAMNADGDEGDEVVDADRDVEETAEKSKRKDPLRLLND
jgi:hypothetical protein